MEIIELPLPGLKLVRLESFDDERGFFKECYRKPKYFDLGIDCEFVQDNLSFSKQGVVRGMHFQSDPGQAKLVSVLNGHIYDVAVDIRPDSPYFGKWTGVYLDAAKHEQLFIPIGFAHGFCTLDDAHVLYKTSSVYNPSTEKGFRFDDPSIGIKWPIQNLVTSKRDQNSPNFKDLFS